jgi:hypothetical protein
MVPFSSPATRLRCLLFPGILASVPFGINVAGLASESGYGAWANWLTMARQSLEARPQDWLTMARQSLEARPQDWLTMKRV